MSVNCTIHRHILIFKAHGDWFERYLKDRPQKKADAVILIPRTGHEGYYEIFRGPGLLDSEWEDSIQTLKGLRPYERDPKYQRYLQKHGKKNGY